MGNRKTPGNRGYVSGLKVTVRLRCVPMFAAPRAGHIQHGNGRDLRFSVGQLVIEADYHL